ncbi:hypothetical protein QYE76_045857 [Lolium multiflorum]|uniref:Uncharacterized protein n=1 Tax=Lolium multiflorum TaxID=4521 RepID=A0AAD8WYL7_LOLMU|nr:hypothetical protein QYE76_045857 [Lolium multiflorum]
MADWRRRSIAGGPSPATPDDGIPVAFHLDFFYYPISFPCNGADGDRRMAVASPATTDEESPATTDEESPATTDEASPATTDEESLATTDEGSPLQPRQCQPVGGGGSRRRLSWSPDVSGGRVNCPSSSQLPPLRDHICFVNGEAVSLWCSEVLEEDDMRDDDNEGDEATRGDEDDEATSSERGEEDDEATSSEHGEEDDEADEEGEDGNMRNDDDDEQDEEDMLTESDEEEEEEPEAPPECENCGSMEKLVMLVPCRHPCYCALCFRLAEWRTGPAGSPPPLCNWFHWIDQEQPDWAPRVVEEKQRRAWARFHEEERFEKAISNDKAERESQIQKLRAEQPRNHEVNQKRMDDEVARRYAEEEVRREAREAERKRLRERVAETQAAEECGDKTGKWPRWTQGK